MGALLEPFFWLAGLLADICLIIVLVQIVLYWLLHFKLIDEGGKYVHSTNEFVNKLTEPVYKKVSEKVPAVGGFDVSPFVVLLALMLLARLFGNFSRFLS